MSEKKKEGRVKKKNRRLEKKYIKMRAKAVEWFQQKQRQILIGSLSCLAGAAILFGYLGRGPTPINYAEAELAFAQWKSSPLDDRLYQSLKEAIRIVPSIEKKYEAVIA